MILILRRRKWINLLSIMRIFNMEILVVNDDGIFGLNEKGYKFYFHERFLLFFRQESV